MFQKGEGCFLWDVENRQYLDFTSGIAVNALGHCDPEMSKLLAQQVSHTLVEQVDLSVLISQIGANPRPHLQPIPQPMDRRIVQAARRKDGRIRRHG
jgi:hypothetical protein